jgi:DNA-binding CsgD family transcriptional regulator
VTAQCAYDGSMSNPTPQEIIAARTAAGQSTADAAAEVGLAVRTWQNYEAGDRRMLRAVLDLYLLYTNQHPEKKLVKRSSPPLRKRTMGA